MGNNPIRYVDPDGRTIKVEVRSYSRLTGWKVRVYTWDNEANCFKNSFGKTAPKNDFIDDVTKSMVYLKNSQTAANMIDELSKSKETVVIEQPKIEKFTKFSPKGKGGVIQFNRNNVLYLMDNTGSFHSTALSLAHEFVHAEDHLIKGDFDMMKNIELGYGLKDAAELWAVIKTNFIAKELGEALRLDYETAREHSRKSGDVTTFINNQ